MNVSFTVTFDYQRFYSESEIGMAGSEARSRIAQVRSVEGAIVMVADRQPSIEIVDELWPWVQNLCFGAVAQLTSGAEVRVNYFSRSGHVELKPVGDAVEVRGDKIAFAIYPKAAFLTALFACGERFDRVMREIKKGDVDFIGNLDYSQRFADMAREALGLRPREP